MKHVLTLVLSFASLITFAGFSAAQPKAEKSQSTGTAVQKSSPKLMTGKVTQVNSTAKTFTVITAIDEGGKQVTFNATKVGLPKVGEVIDITYTEPTAGGPLYVENHNSSRSNKTYP